MYVSTGLRGCASCRPAGRGLGAFDFSEITFQDVLIVAMAAGLVYLSIPERKPKRKLKRAPKKSAGGDWGDMGGGGFVGTLGPVVVLGVLGIVGYYVWQFGTQVAQTMAAGVPSMTQAVS